MLCVKEIYYGHLKMFLLLLTTGKSDMDSKYSLIWSTDFHELTLQISQLEIFVPASKCLAAALKSLKCFQMLQRFVRCVELLLAYACSVKRYKL